MPDDAKFCPNCGVTLIDDTPTPPVGVSNLPKKICCPECGSKNLQYLSETEYSTTVKTKGYSGSKGCLGYLAFGPLGMLCGNCGSGKSQTTVNTATTHAWICKDCGNKFKTKDDLEQEIAKHEKTARSHTPLIALGIIAVFMFVVMLLVVGAEFSFFFIYFVVFFPLIILLTGFLTDILMRASARKKVAALKEELDELEKKMARFQ